MATLPLAKAKQLCNASELQLVQASRQPELGRLSHSQLKSKVARARKLRDKWRDVYEKQRREAQQQQSARGRKGETRSRQKAELFSDVLDRLETRLKTIDESDAGTGKRKTRTTKTDRAQSHRKNRAQTRKQLGQKRATLQSRKSSDSTDTPESQPTEKSAGKAVKKKPASNVAKQQAPQATKQSKRKRARTKSVLLSGLPAADPKSKKHRSAAKTAAKQDRIKISGLTTRTRGHVSARGKRSQARRDAKG